MNTSLLAVLRLSFCRLDIFSMRHPPNWNTFSSELKDALSNIILSSTLKTLNLSKAINVPITLLSAVHLTKLTLSSISVNDFDFGGKRSSSLTPVASRGVGTMTSEAVIDQCLWFFCDPLHDGSAEPIFLPFMCRLRCFRIFIHTEATYSGDIDVLSQLIRSLCTSLTSPATLEELRLDIDFSANDFSHEAFYDYLRDADVWGHLDSILTHPISSRLQRVGIVIRYHFTASAKDEELDPDPDEIEEAVLHSLPLLRRKGILSMEAYWENR